LILSEFALSSTDYIRLLPLEWTIIQYTVCWIFRYLLISSPVSIDYLCGIAILGVNIIL